MPPPIRTQRPTGFDNWQWVTTDDGSSTLLDTRINETFHSGCGAVSETLVVYLHHSGVARRLRERQACVVVEYGLGTATGLLLTGALANACRTRLIYCALESELLPGELIDQLELATATQRCLAGALGRPSAGPDPQFSQEEFQSLAALQHALGNELRELKPGASGRVRWQLSEFVELRLTLGDIRHLTTSPAASLEIDACHAVYFDPFSPESNPELWSLAVLRQAYDLLTPAGRLTSYCVKSQVRRTLTQCGFQVAKLPGPVGGKREVLQAVKPLE